MEGAGEEDFDTHICLSCHTAIVGLDNYVQHKKVDCPSRKVHVQVTSSAPLATTSGSLNVLVTSPMVSSASVTLTSSAALSPTSSAAVDPNVILCNISHGSPSDMMSTKHGVSSTAVSNTTIMDFLSSLELKCRPSPSSRRQSQGHSSGKHAGMPEQEGDGKGTLGAGAVNADGRGGGYNLPFDAFEQGKDGLFDSAKTTLKIASILNDLNFDSDSEGFDMPSDTEGFLDFSDDDYVGYDDDNSPHSHTGGKWRPGYNPSAPGHYRGKGKHPGKHESLETGEQPNRVSHGGKWHPTMGGKWRAGERPSHSGGKGRPGEHRGVGHKGKSIGKRSYEEMVEASEDEAESVRSGHPSGGRGSKGKAMAERDEENKAEEGLAAESATRNPGQSTNWPSIGKNDVYNTPPGATEQRAPVDDGAVSGAGGGTPWKSTGKSLPGEREPERELRDAQREGEGEGAPAGSVTLDKGDLNIAIRDRERHSEGVPDIASGKGVKSEKAVVDNLAAGEPLSGGQQREAVGQVEADADATNRPVRERRTRRSKAEASPRADAVERVQSAGNQDNESTRPHCGCCNRWFVSQKSYLRHMATNLHKIRRDLVAGGDAAVDHPRLHKRNRNRSFEARCPLCDRQFNNKYNFVRHLLSSYHMRRAKSTKHNFLLDEGMQKMLLRLSPFQCQICSFYCNDGDQLEEHLRMAEHRKKASVLTGPLFCVRCRFSCRESEAMVSHVTSESHRDSVSKSDRPCVVKELRNQLQCPSCPGKVFQSGKTLERHNANHHSVESDGKKLSGRNRATGGGKLSTVCGHCTKDCKSLYNLAVHIRRRHTDEKPYICEPCGTAFADKSTLNLHHKSRKHLNALIKLADQTPHLPISPEKRSRGSQSSKRSYKCDFCSFSTAEYSGLRPHYMDCHAASMYSCDTCGVTSMTEAAHKRHLHTTVHKTKEREAAKTTEGSFSCEQCSKKFYNIGSLNLHVVLHRQPKFVGKTSIKEEIGDTFAPLMAQMRRDKKRKKFQCPECSKSLSRCNVMPHIRLHNKSFPYKCSVCTKGFTSNSSLYRHLKMHLGIRPFVCEHCSKDFASQFHLDSHMLKQHKDKAGQVDTKWVCSFCGEKFLQSWLLSNHVRRVHEPDNRPFHCQYENCEYTCCFLSELQIHARKHTNERPFLCDECGYAGKTQQMLTRHRRSHTGERKFQCEYCTYRAAQSWGLRRHMRCHIGVKPYKCPFCTYTCNVIENLKKHILTTKSHRGLCMYNCKQCQFATNAATEFSGHTIREHGVPEKEIGCISTYAGIYQKAEDVKEVPEGSQVLQVRERKVGSTIKKPHKDMKESTTLLKEAAEASVVPVREVPLGLPEANQQGAGQISQEHRLLELSQTQPYVSSHNLSIVDTPTSLAYSSHQMETYGSPQRRVYDTSQRQVYDSPQNLSVESPQGPLFSASRPVYDSPHKQHYEHLQSRRIATTDGQTTGEHQEQAQDYQGQDQDYHSALVMKEQGYFAPSPLLEVVIQNQKKSSVLPNANDMVASSVKAEVAVRAPYAQYVGEVDCNGVVTTTLPPTPHVTAHYSQ